MSVGFRYMMYSLHDRCPGGSLYDTTSNPTKHTIRPERHVLYDT
jgi:hypothetical protein